MTAAIEAIKVEFYKTNVGTFFRRKEMNYYTNQFDKSYLINDIPADSLPTYNGKFLKVDGDITSIKRLVPSATKLAHYELINPELASDKIPSIIHIYEAGKYYDDATDEYAFEGKYASIMSLYKETYVATEPTVQEVAVEFICLGNLQIDNLSKPEEVKINVTRERNYGAKEVEVIDLKSVVRYDDLAQMVVPEFMIHTQPCELTSHQVYKIVRQHIIENYDTKVARLTSNYDFCFTVEKVVDTKPYSVKSEVLTRNNNSYKPPRFSTVKKTNKLTQIFEMSWAGAGKNGGGYGEYSVIPAWKANNFAELVQNMRQYLDELMAVINAPAHECTSCNGTGHIFTSLVKKD